MTSIKTFWINYCENSSLHGLRYVVKNEAKPWERLIWATLMVVAIVTIIVNLFASWETFSYSSIQIVLDNPRYELSKIDFPAITICSINKILYSKAKKLILNKYKNDPEQWEKYENSLYALGMLQYPHYKDLSVFVKKNPVIDLPLENISNIMLNLMPTIDEMFNKCYWRGYRYNCSDIIRLQRTEEGFCYSFNSKTSERTANDSKFNPPMTGLNGGLIPLRNNAAGKMTGLEVILNNLITEYFPIDKQYKGFNVMIHSPEDFPDISSRYKIYSDLNQSSRISVSVKNIQVDSSLYRLSEKDRKCFLHQERTMKHKNFPSRRSNAENNCYSKCRLVTTYRRCKCMPYYFDVNKLGHCCGIEHLECLGEMDVLQRNVQAPEDQPGFPKWSVPVFMNCSCPHSCSFVGYTTEMRNFPKDAMAITDLSYNYIPVEVYYKERFAISYRRSTKYTTQDLLTSFGGMASLFLGCSLVSMVEIVYIVYKSLVMLKHKYFKVLSDSKRLQQQQKFVLYRRYNTYRFCRPLYIPPSDSPWRY